MEMEKNIERIINKGAFDLSNYDGNLINRLSYKINKAIQSVADFGFDKFKDILFINKRYNNKKNTNNNNIYSPFNGKLQ